MTTKFESTFKEFSTLGESKFGKNARITLVKVLWELEIAIQKHGVELIPVIKQVFIWGEDDIEDEVRMFHHICNFKNTKFIKLDKDLMFKANYVELDFDTNTIELYL